MHRISKNENQFCLRDGPSDMFARLRRSKVGGRYFTRDEIGSRSRKMLPVPFQSASEVDIEKSSLLVMNRKIRVLAENFMQPTCPGSRRTRNEKRR